MIDSHDEIRPRRSVLYMPGANARALEKAKTLDCDAVILDLEDAVAPDQKTAARAQVAAAVATGGYGHREVVVRINRLDTPWGQDDLAAIGGDGPDAILLPKVESVDEILELENAAASVGVGPQVTFWAMIETPCGVFAADEIAAASPRLKVLVMGTSDLAKELHARHVPGREPFLHALERCVMAARAAGIGILDGVHLDLADEEGLRAECEQGAAMGFDGKTLIHPKQIATANEVFRPSPEEVEHARAVIAAWNAALAEGKGVAVLNGRLIENLHADTARRILALHEAIERRAMA